MVPDRMHRIHELIGLSAAPLIYDSRPCKDPGSPKKTPQLTHNPKFNSENYCFTVVNFSTLLPLNFAIVKLRPKGVRITSKTQFVRMHSVLDVQLPSHTLM